MTATVLSTPALDLGGDRDSLDSYLVRCGYWNTPEKRRRHAYTLSPSAYVLTSREHGDLLRIAIRTHAAIRSLASHLCVFAQNAVHLSNEDAAFLKLASVATRGLLRPHEGADVPPVMKLDLVRDARGSFKLVEADVYNPRGFGYAALLAESVPHRYRDRPFQGIPVLSEMLKDRSTASWHVLVSEYERYYETAFRILADSLSSLNVSTRIIREESLAHGDNPLAVADGGIANLFAIPESLFRRPLARDALLARYREGSLRTLYPPVAYLGSKAFLPFLRSCEGMEDIIPRSALVGKRFSPRALIADGRPLVLKAAVSSGMKDVFFSDLDESGFRVALEAGSTSKTAGFVLQEQVPQEPVPIVVFDESGRRTTQNYYLRITVYAMSGGVLDAEVTGRPDRKVHGAPDCIQLPIIFS